MPNKRIGLFGGSFNPPGINHLRVAEAIAGLLPHIAIIPCGFRSDKDSTNNIDPIHRLEMVRLTFGHLEQVLIDASDIDSGEFTCNYDLDLKYRDAGYKPWHVIGMDLIAGGVANPTSIRHWKQGLKLWNELRWLILVRDGFDHSHDDLPPHHQLLTTSIPGSSTLIRECIATGAPLKEHVVPAVSEYIYSHNLYQPGGARK
jgi:NAD+ kinase